MESWGWRDNLEVHIEKLSCWERKEAKTTTWGCLPKRGLEAFPQNHSVVPHHLFVHLVVEHHLCACPVLF